MPTIQTIRGVGYSLRLPDGERVAGLPPPLTNGWS
jgi:hypothetical protein